MSSKSLIKRSAKSKTTPKENLKSRAGGTEIVETKKVSKKNKNKHLNEDINITKSDADKVNTSDIEYLDSDREDYIKVNLDNEEQEEVEKDYDDEEQDNKQEEEDEEEQDKLGGDDEDESIEVENNESPVEDDGENNVEDDVENNVEDESVEAENNIDSDKESTSAKTSSKKKGKNIDNQNIPELEVVSNAIKERYEYKPLLRTEIVYVLPEDRITSEVMTKFEYCEVISIRAKQIENGASSFTDIGDLTDPIEIAKKEIADKKCPLDIIRMKTDKIAERWHVNEMAIPYD